MRDASDSSIVSTTSQVPLSIIGRLVVAHMIDNFDALELDALEARLLALISENRQVHGVIFNFSEVITTDAHDLRRLQMIFMAIKLVGGRIGLCGINPGLAAVIVAAKLDFQREVIGTDIDDVATLL